MKYFVYPNNYNYLSSNPDFNAQTWQSNNYVAHGTINDVNSEHTNNYPGSDYTIYLPSGPYATGGQVTIVNQGYFHATESGAYTFTTNNTMDNGMFVWSGQNAYSGYTNQNWDYGAQRLGQPVVTSPGSVTYHLTAGQLWPMTIMFVNGGGPGRAVISVTNPDGITSGTSGYFLPACDSSTFSP